LERFQANTYLSMIPVIVVSARNLHENKERALRGGARAFVQKPWSDEILLAIIAKLIAPGELSLSQVNYGQRLKDIGGFRAQNSESIGD